MDVIRRFYCNLTSLGIKPSYPLDLQAFIRTVHKNLLLTLVLTLPFHLYLYVLDPTLLAVCTLPLGYIYVLEFTVWLCLVVHFPKLAGALVILGSYAFFFLASAYFGKESYMFLFLFNSGILSVTYFYTNWKVSFAHTGLSCFCFFTLFFHDFEFEWFPAIPKELQGHLSVYLISIQFLVSFFISRWIFRTIETRKKMLQDSQEKSLALLEEAKELNLKLEKSRKLEALIFNQSYDAKFLEDHQSDKILDCNIRALDMFGVKSKEELLGKRGRDLHAQPFSQVQGDFINATLMKDGQYFGEFEYKGKEGKPFWGGIAITILHAQEKTYRLVSVSDITSIKKASRAIEKRERQLQMAQKIGRMGSFNFDMETRTMAMSEELKTLIGGDVGSENPDFTQYIDPGDLKENWKEIEALLTHGKPFHADIKLIHKNGKTLYASTRAEVIRDQDWSIKEIIGTIQDMTNRKIREELLQVRNEELKKINEELDSFVYSAAHDLRAPIVNVMGLAGLIQQEENIETIRTYAEFQNKAMVRLDTFIKDIIDYSRNNRMEIKKEAIDLQKLLEEVFSDYSFYEQADKIEKKIHIHASCDLIQDKGRLKMILNNLVSNAIRYSDLEKETCFIHCEAQIESSGLRLKIEDNGQGIQEAYLEKIFNMFYRAHEKSEGSGIGLYITKEATTKLGGTIEVISTYKEGTTFTLYLPNFTVSHKALSSKNKREPIAE